MIRKECSLKAIEEMEKNLSSPPSLYIEDEHDTTRQKESVQKILGNGGCKKAIQLSKGKALLIPNMDCDDMGAIQSRWPRIVEEEIQMSIFLQSIGLLGLQLQKVKVFSEKDSEHCILAYVTDSFDKLKEKNIYIIDAKNEESSTWKDNRKLFRNIEDAKNPKNWRPIIELLAKDIAKLVHYQLPLGGDSFNVAIVGSHDDYKIRYFGFDYTSKVHKISIPVVEEKKSSQVDKSQEKQLLARINRVFSNAIEQVLFQEYQEKHFLPKEAYDIIDKLKDTYSKVILKEVYAFQGALVNNIA